MDIPSILPDPSLDPVRLLCYFENASSSKDAIGSVSSVACLASEGQVDALVLAVVVVVVIMAG